MVPEGIEGMVPYRGSLKSTIYQLIGGLKSSMGYCGAKNIELMRINTKFIRVSTAGVQESHPHDVRIMKEAPNYQMMNNSKS
jgi:IMP dehydrogenase